MRMRWMARWMLPILQEWASRREPDFKVIKPHPVTSVNDDSVLFKLDKIYLKRWWVVPRNDWMNIYLHNMLGDDDADLHDHSYWSVSLVLTEGLREVYLEDPEVKNLPRALGSKHHPLFSEIRYPQPGDIVVRSPRMAHQLTVFPGSDPWTLFITGPRLKNWGFWCRRGWIPWTSYVKTDPARGRGTGTSGVGVGCGEE